MDQPIKIKSKNGKEYYSVRQLLLLGFFTLVKEYVINVDDFTPYIYGLGYIYGDIYSTGVRIQDNKDPRNLHYAGAVSGGIQTENSDFKKYIPLDIIQYLDDVNNQLRDIQTSVKMDKYFILTKKSILIFNIHTDILEDKIILTESIPSSNLQIIEQLKSIIFFSDKVIYLRMYKGSNLIDQYSFSQMKLIKNVQFNPQNNSFFVYGDGFVVLNQQLVIEKQILLMGQYSVNSCIITINQYICQLENGKVLNLDSHTYKISSIINPRGFSPSDTQLAVDVDNSRIFLIEKQIQVYNLSGLFQQEIKLIQSNLLTFEINDDYIIITFEISNSFSFKFISQIIHLFTKSFYFWKRNQILHKLLTYCNNQQQKIGIIVINRKELTSEVEFDSISGFRIQQSLYISFFKQITYCMESTFFAQIIVVDIVSKVQVGKISQLFVENKKGIVVQTTFDDNNTLLSFLDMFGNFQVIFFFQSNQILGTVKILEIVENSEKPLGYSLNYETGNIYVYCERQLYKINYNEMQQKYLTQSKTQQKMFTIINNNNYRSSSSTDQPIIEKYLILGEDNYIYRYEQKSLIIEAKFQDEIIDLKYSSKFAILILVFKTHFKYFTSYEYGNPKSLEQFSQSDIFYIEKIIDDDIFFSFDKKFVHYDYTTNKPNYTKQYRNQTLLTCSYVNPTKDIIVIGFNDGEISIYYKQTQTFNHLPDFQNLSSNFIYKSIRQIVQKFQNEIYVLTLQGQFMVLNISSHQVIQVGNLLEFTEIDINTQIFLNNFLVDVQNNRIIFQFYGFNYGYVWNINDNILDGYINFSNDQLNTVFLSELYIILFSTNQVNIYTRNGEISFVNSIKVMGFYNEIKDVLYINKNIVIIFFTNKIRVYYFSTLEVILMDEKILQQPLVIESYYNAQLNQYRIVGISQQGIFDSDMQSLNKQNKFSFQCGQKINSLNPFQTEQQIQIINPGKQEIQIIAGKSLKIPDNSMIYLFINVESNSLPFLNQLLLNQGQSSQQSLVLSLPDDNGSEFIVGNNTFSYLQQSLLTIKNANFKFEQQTQQILFSNETTKFQGQRIKIQNIENLNGVSFAFINFEEVILYDLKIQNNNLKSINSDINDYLFMFQDIQNVIIFNITISNNILSKHNFKKLFCFKNVINVEIIKGEIEYNNELNKIFTFQQIQSIQIHELKINQNQRIYNGLEQIKMINIKSCSNVIMSNIQYLNNQYYTLLDISNNFKLKQQTIILSEDQLSINNSLIQNNNNQVDPILIIQSSFINFSHLDYLNNRGNILIQQPIELQINDCQILQNTGQNGGGFQINKLSNKLNLTNTTISQNYAIGSGGAIYFEDLNTNIIEIDDKSQIQDNHALIGGGVRFVQKQVIQQLPDKYPFKDNIKNNSAEIYGNNACSYIQKVSIENSQQQESIEKIQNNIYNYYDAYEFNFTKNEKKESVVTIKNFKSSGSAYFNIYLIDEEDRVLSFFLDKLHENEYPDDIAAELKFMSISIISEETGIQFSGQTIINYNAYSDKLRCFQIRELQISSSPLSKKQNTIIAFVNKYKQEESIKIYFEINFRRCMLGEIIMDTISNIQICQFCSDGNYSLEDPEKIYELQNKQLKSKSITSTASINNFCKKCPDSALKCIGSQIYLQNGFWRKDNLSDEISPCNANLNSCLAEESNDQNNICKLGYQGPLCEECDLIGSNQQQNRYVSSIYSKDCQKCSNSFYQYTFFGLQIIAILLYLVYNTYRFVENFNYVQSCYYIRQLKLLPLSKPPFSTHSTSNIKILLAYIQFTSLLITQPTLFPIEINIIPNVLGSSNKLIVLSLSCIFPKYYFTDYGKAYIYSIINTITPLSFLIFSSFILFQIQFNNQNRNPNYKKYYLYAIINIVYMFFLLDFVQYFTTVLTCRKIGSYSYQSLDLLLQCDDPIAKTFLVPYSAILLLVWSTIPLIKLYMLIKRSKQLDLCITKFRFGYFYQELRKQYYYWEFIRLYVKILVVVLFTLLRTQHLMLARQTAIIIFSIYIRFVSIKKPFISSSLNYLEVLSYKIISVKILLSSFKDEFQQLPILIDIAIYICDIYFLPYLIAQLLKVYINNKNSLVGKFLIGISKIICTKNYVKNITKYREPSFIIYQRWKFVKNNLKKVISMYSSRLSSHYSKRHQEQHEKLLFLSNRTLNKTSQQASIIKKIQSCDNTKYLCWSPFSKQNTFIGFFGEETKNVSFDDSLKQK